MYIPRQEMKHTVHTFLSILLGLMTLSVPSIARAAGGGGGHDGTNTALTTVVTLVLGAGAAYLLAHFVVDGLQKRFLINTNVEYIGLGILLGPAVAAIPAFQDLTPIAPIIALATGWVGLLYGMELNLRKLLGTRDHSLRLALMDGAGVVLPVLFTTQWFLQAPVLRELGMDPLSRQDAWLCAWILALTTWAGSSDAMRVVQLRYPQKGAVLNTLIQTAHLGDLLAITGFGFLFCAFHHEVIPQSALRTPTAVEWGVITLGIGTVLGGLFTVFLGKEDEGAKHASTLGGHHYLRCRCGLFPGSLCPFGQSRPRRCTRQYRAARGQCSADIDAYGTAHFFDLTGIRRGTVDTSTPLAYRHPIGWLDCIATTRQSVVFVDCNLRNLYAQGCI